MTEYWQLSCKGMIERAKFLFSTGIWADCEFIVGPEMQPIRAHRFILAMASPVFETMFYGSLPEGNPVITPDVDSTTFIEMLRLIYTDKVTIDSITVAQNLYYCAKKYMIPYLQKICVRFLSVSLTAQNVFEIYEHAKFYEDHELIDACLKVMQFRTSEILISDGFLEAPLETIVLLFSLEVLNIASEIQLVEAADKYSREGADTHNDVELIDVPPDIVEVMDSSDSETDVIGGEKRLKGASWYLKKAEAELCVKIKKEEPKATIKTALQEIRFLTLTPSELAKSEAVARLLTREERYAILMNISSEDTFEPMPYGFSTSRAPRNQPYLFGAVFDYERSIINNTTGVSQVTSGRNYRRHRDIPQTLATDLRVQQIPVHSTSSTFAQEHSIVRYVPPF